MNKGDRPLAATMPWNDRQGRFSALRAACFALVLVPALLLAHSAWMGQLGSKPWTQAVHETGTWAIRILIVTLAVSPLRRMLDYGKLIGIRRMLGLAAMAYALAHLALYCVDLAFDWGLIVSEIVKRFYLTVGFVALLGLVALGVTSTDGMIRRMGGKNWQRMHNLVYVIAMLGLFHFALQSKLDVSEPVLTAGLFLLLMSYRWAVRLGRPLNATTLIACALLCGLATALGEATWYALATGAPPLAVLQANGDVFVYGELAFLRPGPIVLLVGLSLALAQTVRAALAGPAPAPRRGRVRA